MEPSAKVETLKAFEPTIDRIVASHFSYWGINKFPRSKFSPQLGNGKDDEFIQGHYIWQGPRFGYRINFIPDQEALCIYLWTSNGANHDTGRDHLKSIALPLSQRLTEEASSYGLRVTLHKQLYPGVRGHMPAKQVPMEGLLNEELWIALE